MDKEIKRAIEAAVRREPYARGLNLELTALDDGFSRVEMTYEPAVMDNIYGRAHGGAVFGLIDEAFETASQTDGTIAVALNVSVTYVSSPESGTRLKAEARETARTRKTLGFDIKVTDAAGRTVALCQALGYRTGKPVLAGLTPPE